MFVVHSEVAAVLAQSTLPWFMTYDCDDRITDELYPNLRCAQFNIKHTAHQQHIGSEYAVYSDNLKVPHLKHHASRRRGLGRRLKALIHDG